MPNRTSQHADYPKSSVIGKFTLFSSLMGSITTGIISVVDTYRLKGELGDVFQFVMVTLFGGLFLVVPALVTAMILAQRKMVIKQPIDYAVIALIGVVIWFVLFFLTGKEINLQGSIKFIVMGSLSSIVAAKMALPQN